MGLEVACFGQLGGDAESRGHKNRQTLFAYESSRRRRRRRNLAQRYGVRSERA
jgi:hypothetical protein